MIFTTSALEKAVNTAFARNVDRSLKHNARSNKLEAAVEAEDLVAANVVVKLPLNVNIIT